MSEPLPDRRTADPAVLRQLGADARDEAGPFVDPRLLPATRAVQARTPRDWQEAVLGRPLGGLRDRPVSWAEAVLLLRAAELDADHLTARTEAARSAARHEQAAAQQETTAQQEAELAAWEQLRDRLPVDVRVRHNWTLGHYATGYADGRDHIVVTEDLHAGRLHRPAWTALCHTPSRAHDLRGLDTSPDSTYAEDRVPDCRGCLTYARRLAART